MRMQQGQAPSTAWTLPLPSTHFLRPRRHPGEIHLGAFKCHIPNLAEPTPESGHPPPHSLPLQTLQRLLLLPHLRLKAHHGFPDPTYVPGHDPSPYLG